MVQEGARYNPADYGFTGSQYQQYSTEPSYGDNGDPNGWTSVKVTPEYLKWIQSEDSAQFRADTEAFNKQQEQYKNDFNQSHNGWDPVDNGGGYMTRPQQEQAAPTGPREPTLQEILMQDALNKQLAGSERYDNLTAAAGDLSSGARNALTQSETAGDWYFDQAKGNYNSATSTLDQARTAGDPWYQQANDTFGKANGLIDQQVDQLNYSKEGNQWYDNYVREQLGQAAGMTSSGEIPKAFQDALMGSINRGLESSMGQMINDMAGRGVINSSVSTSGMNDLGQQAANAYQDAYMENFMNLLGGIQGNAQQGTAAGDTFGRTNLDIATGYGDAAGNATNLGNSYANTGSMRTNDLVNVAGGYTQNAGSLMGAGSQRINDWLGINKGYNDTLNQNLLERQYLNSAVPQYWQNALGPFSIVPPLLGQQQQDFANTGKNTTVVG
jgi:hypothetical protein